MTRLALALVAVHGVVWALFLRALAAAGHAPTGPLAIPIERAAYYAAESWFVLPVLYVGVLAQTGAMHGAAVLLRGEAPWTASLRVAALSSSGAGLVCWLLPEIVAYAVAGFDALPSVLRVVVPAFAIAAFLSASLLLRRAYGLGGARALLVAFVGGFAYAALTTPFLR